MLGKYQFLGLRPNTRCPTTLLGLGTGDTTGSIVHPLVSGSWEGGVLGLRWRYRRIWVREVYVGILKAQGKCFVNYGIISVFDNQYGYSGSCQLNISPEFGSRLQIISVPLRLYIQDFPGGPVPWTPCSQWRGPGFDLWSENWIPHAATYEFECHNWRIPPASTKTWHGPKYTYLNTFFKRLNYPNKTICITLGNMIKYKA